MQFFTRRRDQESTEVWIGRDLRIWCSDADGGPRRYDEDDFDLRENLARLGHAMSSSDRGATRIKAGVTTVTRRGKHTTRGNVRSGRAGIVVIAVLVLLLVALVVTGVIYFRTTDDTTEIIIDKAKLENQADSAVRKGKQVIRKTGEELRRIGEDKPVDEN